MASAMPSSLHLARIASCRGFPSQRSSSPKWMRTMRAANCSFIAMPPFSPGASECRRSRAGFSIERPIGVLDNVHVGKYHQPFLDHLVYKRKKRAQFFGRINDREHNRAMVIGEWRFVFVYPPMRSIAKDAAIHRDSRNVVGAHGRDQGFVERLVLPAVLFAEEYAHHLRLAFDLEMGRRGRSFVLRNLGGLGHRGLLYLDQPGAGQFF